jgi:sugar (pentulose or hexulose) kinase
VLGLPLELTAVEEGSAFGAALLAGVAGGDFGGVEDAAAACVRVRETIEPDPAAARVYDELQPAYRALYPALEETMKPHPETRP